MLFTLEAGRHDPRLFDELLDWLVLNEQLVSVQRLRNLCTDQADRALVDASLEWVGRWRPRPRLSKRTGASGRDEPPAPLFVGLATPRDKLDPAFERHGLLRPDLQPSGKSSRPELSAPINLAFRLRRLLGVSVRAEIVRALLTIDAPRISAGVLYASAGFTRQNVREALSQLQDAGVTSATGVRSERFLSLRRDAWARLLGLDEDQLPQHRDWIQALGALRSIIRWLDDPRIESLSDYMRASEARVLLDRLEPELRFVGVPVAGQAAKGSAYWEEFVATVRGLLATL